MSKVVSTPCDLDQLLAKSHFEEAKKNELETGRAKTGLNISRNVSVEKIRVMSQLI